jgi:hypothetical protein
MLDAQQLLVVVIVASALPERDLVVHVGANRRQALPQTLLAQSAVTFPDTLAILNASPSALALDRIGPNWSEHSDAAARCLQPGLQCRELHGLIDPAV